MLNDKVFWDIFTKGQRYQDKSVSLIASENYVSAEVLKAQGSYLSNKYAEGYVGRRYYMGCTYHDQIESLAAERLKSLFKVNYVNVQPHSGSQANQAVFQALLKPEDCILSLALDHGGHLTHGHHMSSVGKMYQIKHYFLNEENNLCYESIRKLAQLHKPKLIITGYSSFSYVIDFQALRKIADEVGAYLLADISHISGLIAGGVYPSPVEYADVITSTTHKTLRGPRGAVIMSKHDNKMTQKIQLALFPGIQGGPMMHTIGAKAVAFYEALQPTFATYARQIVTNAQTLELTLQERGISMVFQNTKTHMLTIDLSQYPLSGRYIASSLEKVKIITNANMIPRDSRSAWETSGVRLGTAAMTTRGWQEEEFRMLGHIIADLIDAELAQKGSFHSVLEQRVEALIVSKAITS